MKQVKMICPVCRELGFDDREEVEMEKKGSIEQGNCDSGCCPYGVTLYQCPKCKNVELD